jgi:hypothetical protein
MQQKHRNITYPQIIGIYNGREETVVEYHAEEGISKLHNVQQGAE